MIQHNCFYGCSVYEQSGERASEGRGSTQCYPSREVASKQDMHSTENMEREVMKATAVNRVKGIT